AHCVVYGPDIAPSEDLRVLGGTSDLNLGGTYRNIEEIYPDPEYDATNLGEHDDAVIVLESALPGPVTTYVGPGDTALWNNVAGIPVGADGPWIGGWGVRYLDPVFGPFATMILPRRLQEAKVPIVADSECEDG